MHSCSYLILLSERGFKISTGGAIVVVLVGQ